MLVEQYVGGLIAESPGVLRAPTGPVLLHAHCHQKALWGAETSAAPLRRVFGENLKVLDTGCCGMAGSFGYAEKNYELSVKIAELGLAPAVRAAGEGRGDRSDGDVMPSPGARHHGAASRAPRSSCWRRRWAWCRAGWPGSQGGPALRAGFPVPSAMIQEERKRPGSESRATLRPPTTASAPPAPPRSGHPPAATGGPDGSGSAA